MQPTYLPWSGYFNLIANVDSFVFLDDVQFDRRSWQMRNRILSNDKEVFLSMSTVKNARNTLIKDIKLSERINCKEKHIKQIYESYIKAPFFNDLSEIVSCLNTYCYDSLSDVDIELIKLISEIIGIKTKFYKASDLECDGKRAEHLGNICRKIKSSEYLSPLGSLEYLDNDKFIDKYPDISLAFQNYTPPAYKQFNSSVFISSLSIIDVIANIGIQKTRNYIL